MKKALAICIFLLTIANLAYSQGEVFWIKYEIKESNLDIYATTLTDIFGKVRKDKSLAAELFPIYSDSIKSEPLGASRSYQIPQDLKTLEKIVKELLEASKKNEIPEEVAGAIESLEKLYETTPPQDAYYAEKEQSIGPFSVFNQSFVEIFTNGKVQVTGSLIRIMIGSRTGFRLPFYLYASATGSNGVEKDTTNNELTMTNLLNPLGGIASLTFYKDDFIRKGNNGIDLNLQLSGRLLPAPKNSENEYKFIPNIYMRAGLMLKTDAWSPDNTTLAGSFVINMNFVLSMIAENDAVLFFDPNTRNLMIGYTIEAKLAIEKIVAIKAGYYFLNVLKDIPVDSKLSSGKGFFKISIDKQF